MSDTQIPQGLLYSKEHEWIKKIDSDKALMGITDYAQNSLGDIVYIELPEIGKELAKGDTFGVVESVKAASDMYSSCSGIVVKINEALNDNPEIVNQDPYEKGWMIELGSVNENDLNELMDNNQYQEYVASLDEES